ncbi:MAG TPA: carbon-nitrogen hydrolase [Planctomycetaceae bacterium]|nr:carbon-nitrogen hydrolase [Planctomycetaceae bacterium]HIQ21525.1 carbon-nitrogen hydrolase [Planctomycetota bacterium]
MSDSPHTPAAVAVGLVQMRVESPREANVQRALDRISQAADAGAQIVCLPELFAIPYPCQDEDHARFDQAEPIPGPTTGRLADAARRHGVVVVGSIFERRAPGLYHNTAVVLDADGSLAGVYRKMHIPDDPLYYEKFYFTPGDLGFPSFATRHGRLGVGICWDQWFPEAARLLALAGAQILLYPTAIGWLPADRGTSEGDSQHGAWETMIRSHAVANGLFVVAVNRTGREGQLEFWGGSLACDPNGNVLARADRHGEQTLVVPCHLGQIDAVRTHWPFLRDRRIDAYGDLLKRFLD